jgi:putative ABC transport system permease protein
VLFNIVSEGYFDVLGTPLLRGRGFEVYDREGSVPVAVIDETMAERFWPGEDPLGKRVSIIPEEQGEPEWRTVVGVAANVRHYEIQSPSRIQIYLPARQATRYAGTGLSALVKVVGDEAATTKLLRASVAERKPGIPVSDVRTLETLVDRRLGTQRALGTVTTAFGSAAAVLACFGIFGVLTLVVSRRGREIGIRMAVGAAPGAVIRMVVARGMGLTLGGALLGLVGAGAAGRMLGSVLYQVTPWDPGVHGGAVAVLLVVALIAVAHPAARAAGVAPSRVLREE